MSKVYILGLDGASWDLFIPLVEKGWMPNLKRVMEEGIYGLLESTMPPVSAPAWVSFLTGVNPGKHGIYDFFWMNEKEKIPVDSTFISVPAIWDLLEERKIKVGLVNLPITYPPPKVNGFLISGFMIPQSVKDYTYPSHLKEEIIKKFGEYSTDPYVKADQSEEFLKRIIYWVDLREKINLYLIEKYKPEVFINVYQATDVIGHFFWNCLNEKNPQYSEKKYFKYESLFKKCFELIDRAIGNRLSLLKDEDILIIISDHGFQDAVYRFNLAAFLKKRGYIKMKREVKLFDPIELLKKVDFFRIRNKLLSRWLKVKIKSKLEEGFTGEIDFDESLAYPGSLSSQAIFINKKKNYEEIKKNLIKDLKELRNPENNEKVLSGVYSKEEVYQGPFLEDLPDIVFDVNKNYKLVLDFTSKKIIVNAPFEEGGGQHSLFGIYAFFGKNLKFRGNFKPVKIQDILPTVLYYLNIPIPDYMDGKPIVEIFDLNRKPEYYNRELKIVKKARGSYSEEEKKEVMERLRNLGYVE